MSRKYWITWQEHRNPRSHAIFVEPRRLQANHFLKYLRRRRRSGRQESLSSKQPSQSNPILKGCRRLGAEEVQVSYFPNGPLHFIFPTWWQIYRLWQRYPPQPAAGWAGLNPSSGLTETTEADRWRSRQLSSLTHSLCFTLTSIASCPDPTLTDRWVLRNFSIFNLPSLFITPQSSPSADPSLLNLFHIHPSLCCRIFLQLKATQSGRPRHKPQRQLWEVFNTFRDKVGSLDADISFKKLKDKTGSII